ncbi:MAG: RNA polymerase sigma-70 factor [Bacteroidales bacterium]|nr:RNA polymerase sigma-70 factor [Bacteroidales bacterium]
MSSSKSHIHERLEAGDIKAFEMLYNEQYTPLCHFAQRFVFDLDTAREIVQGVFVYIWEKRTSLPSDISLKNYLYTSVRNKCIDYLKHQNIENEYKKKRIKEVIEHGNNSFSIIDHPLDGLITKELENAIKDAINNLPEKCREIFELSRFEGLKYREIAEELNISVKTVETQMSRALESLKKKLSHVIKI